MFLEGTFILHLTKEPKDLRSSCSTMVSHCNLKLKATATHNIQWFLYSANKQNFCSFFLLSVLHFHPPHLRRLSDNMSFLASLLVSPCLDPFLLSSLPPSLALTPVQLPSRLCNSPGSVFVCEFAVVSHHSSSSSSSSSPALPKIHFTSPHLRRKRKNASGQRGNHEGIFLNPPPR